METEEKVHIIWNGSSLPDREDEPREDDEDAIATD